MANVSKYKLPQVLHMTSHYGRQQGENIRRGNQKINKEMTYKNYDIHTGAKADGKDMEMTKALSAEQKAFIEKRLSEIKHPDLTNEYNYNHINVMCDWVVTLPDNVSDDKADEFFKNVYDFACDRYGKENVISSWVHKDETSLHMHFAFMPVVKDEDGSERLCCREVLTRTELSRFHPELQKYVEEKMKQNVAILNGATAGGNLTIIELKMRDALKELAVVKARTGALETAQPIIENSLKMISEIDETYRKLDEALKAKKWMGDDDKAKMKALTKELNEIKEAAETASKTAAVLKASLQELNKNVNTHLNDIFDNLRDAETKAQKRIKRTENKLRRREERLIEKEQNIATEIEKGVAEKLTQFAESIRKKKAEAARLDKEIIEKKQQLIALDTEFFEGQGYLCQARNNQKHFTKLMQEWSDQNESQIYRPAVPER